MYNSKCSKINNRLQTIHTTEPLALTREFTATCQAFVNEYENSSGNIPSTKIQYINTKTVSNIPFRSTSSVSSFVISDSITMVSNSHGNDNSCLAAGTCSALSLCSIQPAPFVPVKNCVTATVKPLTTSTTKNGVIYRRIHDKIQSDGCHVRSSSTASSSARYHKDVNGVTDENLGQYYSPSLSGDVRKQLSDFNGKAIQTSAVNGVYDLCQYFNVFVWHYVLFHSCFHDDLLK